jgi:hypothetical protein
LQLLEINDGTTAVISCLQENSAAPSRVQVASPSLQLRPVAVCILSAGENSPPVGLQPMSALKLEGHTLPCGTSPTADRAETVSGLQTGDQPPARSIHVTNIVRGGFTPDRTGFVVVVESLQGRVSLHFPRFALEGLISTLHQLEQRASVLDLQGHLIPGEMVELRVRLTEEIGAMAGSLDGKPLVILQSSSNGIASAWGLTCEQASGAAEQIRGALREAARLRAGS